MYTFLLYILKVSLSLTAFYLFYKLLCSRDTWHRANRILLLTILALSAVIPFIHIDLSAMNAETAVIIEELGMAFVAEPMADEAVLTDAPTLWQRIPWQEIPWRTVLTGLYLMGLAVYLIKFVSGLASIGLLIRRSKCREMADGTILVTHTKGYSPFSWIRYIIVSESDLNENYDMILAHERAHIRLGHSWDLLFVQLCATMQWFNPAAWLLKRELEAIHEYEADSATLHEGFDARQYQLRLFEAATGMKYSSFTNNFINCSTKKRIVMMMKKQTSPWALLKALYVLPVAFVAVTTASAVESVKEMSVQEAPVVNEASTTNDVALPATEDDEVFEKVDVDPVYPGGIGELMKFVNTNIKYPKEAMDKGTQGRVVVQFVVEKDGSIADAKVVKPVDPLLDAESLRVINSMPKWTPGKVKGEAVRVRFTMPISFRLADSKPKQVEQVQVSADQKVVTGIKTEGNEFTSTTVRAKEDDTYMVVEEQPEYPGGMAEMLKFLQKEVKYPKEAIDKKAQGRVIVQFVVDKDGSIVEAKVVKSVDPSLDAEALRVVNAMPKWTPGKQKGEPVRTRFTLPVAFGLPK